MNFAKRELKPIPIWQSILIGIIITFLLLILFYILRPVLEKAGLSQYAAYLLSLSCCSIVLIIWSVLAFLSEENPRKFKDFLKRTRFNHLPSKWLYWAIGLGILMLISTLVFSPIISKLISKGIIPLPEDLPDYINPIKQLSISNVKAQLISQGVVLLIPVALILNIVSEEIFWRGIILPRQELQHGKNAFWIHGVIWAFTHLFQYWLIIPILIGSVALAYVIQRTKCTWISILAHLLNNGIPFIIMAFI